MQPVNEKSSNENTVVTITVSSEDLIDEIARIHKKAQNEEVDIRDGIRDHMVNKNVSLAMAYYRMCISNINQSILLIEDMIRRKLDYLIPMCISTIRILERTRGNLECFKRCLDLMDS